MGDSSNKTAISNDRGLAKIAAVKCAFQNNDDLRIATEAAAALCVEAVDYTLNKGTYTDFADTIMALHGTKPTLSLPVEPALALTDRLTDEARDHGKGVYDNLAICLKDNGTCANNSKFSRAQISSALGATKALEAGLTPDHAYNFSQSSGAISGAFSAGRKPNNFTATVNGQKLTVEQMADLILSRHSREKIENEFKGCLMNNGQNDITACTNTGIRRSIVRHAGY